MYTYTNSLVNIHILCKHTYIHICTSYPASDMTRWTQESITKSVSEALGIPGPRAESRRAPGIHKSHLRYICYPYWKPNLGIRLQPQSYSSMCFPHGCFCTRSECIRTGSERRIRNPAKDQSRFGMVNSKSNSMASFLLTKNTQGRLWTLSGCIFDQCRPQCGDSGGTYVPAGMKVLPPATK